MTCFASRRVRSPVVAKVPKASLVALWIIISVWLFMRCSMMLSAPLQSRMIYPFGSCKTTDILFRVLLNSNSWRSLNETVLWRKETLITFYSSVPKNSKPQNLAKLIKASSSGELLKNSNHPEACFSAMTVWQNPKNSKYSIT